MHAMALAACVLNSLPVFIKLALFTAITIHGYFEFKRLSTEQHQIEQFETNWQLGDGKSFVDIQILPSTVITTVAIFLQFKKDDNAKGTLLVFSDALAEDDYRCLIVRLKTTLSRE